ncbi:MAG: O-acetyl-ADP-ribose deacetylase [Gammaproteobacteria bacterium]|nr:O-acetyl-ADP-ribose deacetylase [Gammaproteobacteria bacterium]
MIEVVEGDITALAVDAVVNAANSRLAGGGGVDGAIHRAAGHDTLQAACRVLGGCPTGEVRLTPGFALPARAIIHAVGPVWQGGGAHEEELLARCYRNAMAVASAERFRSLAFPAISCGVYGFPSERAVPIAVREVRAALARPTTVKQVLFCCFDAAMAARYRAELARIQATFPP